MKRIVVIGLGIFGINLVKQLYEGGLEVLAILTGNERMGLSVEPRTIGREKIF